VEQLQQAWRARRTDAGLQAKLCFEADELVLGARTVLAKANESTGLRAIDDGQQQTGALAEYKGPGYKEHMLKDDGPWHGMLAGIPSQSKAQAGAAGARPIEWDFAEKGVADYFRGVFAEPNKGRENIRVEWEPIPRNRQ